MNSVQLNRQRFSIKGFTLVEVLLAITISTGMLVVVMYLYQQSAHIRLTVQQEADRISTVRLVMQRMSNELRSCKYFEHKKLGIKGTSERIEMISTGVLEEGAWGAISSSGQSGPAAPRDAGSAGGAGGSATSAGSGAGEPGAAARVAAPRIQYEMDLRKISYGLKRSKSQTTAEPTNAGNPGTPGNFGSAGSGAAGGNSPAAARPIGAGGLVVDGIWRGEQRLLMVEDEPMEEKKNPAAVVVGGEIVADEPEESGGPLLTDRIRFMRLRYWDGKEWLDSWDAEQLPAGVEVTIGIEPLPEGMEAKDYPHEVFRRIIALPVRKVNDGDLHRPVVGAEESA